MSDFKTVTDSRGRVIKFRELRVLDQARVMKAVGKELSDNAPYVGLATVACMCSEIDGVPYPLPRNVVEVEAMIGRLDNEGYLALQTEAEKMKDASSESEPAPRM